MWQKIELYIISLWFLFVLLLINKIRPVCFGLNCEYVGIENAISLNLIPIICLVFIILGGIFYWRFNFIVERGGTNLPKKITKIEDLYFENLSFLITYIIPLVCFDLDFDLSKDRNLLMLTLVLFLIGVIYVKTNIFYTNPSLAILGYRIYKVSTIESENLIVIARERLQEGDNIYPRRIDENIFFVSKANP